MVKVKVFEQIPTYDADDRNPSGRNLHKTKLPELPIGYSKVTVMEDKVLIETTIIDPIVLELYMKSDHIEKLILSGYGVIKP